ncbi:MAG: SDR family NAD(P)-dependent oxidoreductase [Phycisphaerae bacterium]
MAPGMTPTDTPVALITGAGKGIGRATALELAGRGYRLALVSRTEADLNETAALAKVRSQVIPADVADAPRLEQAVDEVVMTFGRLDAVVHAAGVAPLQPIDQTSVETFRNVIDVNLTAAFVLARASWPQLKRTRGVIVNVSSMSARDPLGGFSAYAAAKAGVNLLTLDLAREGAAHGIRAHCVAPGAVETGMFRLLADEAAVPRGTILEPAEVARVIAECVCGSLTITSGETIYLKRGPE